MTGIYKITNPSGKAYIGQSVDIMRRMRHYENLYCTDQPALFYSLKKYGFHKHIIEIIEECEIEFLNERERYWQEFYNSVKKGLNCKYTQTKDKKGYLSDETKRKIGDAQKGVLNHRYGKKGLAGFKGKKHKLESKKKISDALKGRKKSEETRKKISEAKKGILNPMFGTIAPTAVNVKCTITGKIYNSIREAADDYGIKYST